MPRDPNAGPLQHSGFVASTNDTPPRFYGVCAAGDFYAPDRHDDKDKAQADVDKHVAAQQQ